MRRSNREELDQYLADLERQQPLRPEEVKPLSSRVREQTAGEPEYKVRAITAFVVMLGMMLMIKFDDLQRVLSSVDDVLPDDQDLGAQTAVFAEERNEVPFTLENEVVRSQEETATVADKAADQVARTMTVPESLYVLDVDNGPELFDYETRVLTLATLAALFAARYTVVPTIKGVARVGEEENRRRAQRYRDRAKKRPKSGSANKPRRN